MDELAKLYQQLNNLLFYLQRNTKLNIYSSFDITEILVSVCNNNGDIIYTHHVEGIDIKQDSIIIFELKQVINYLINLKNEIKT